MKKEEKRFDIQGKGMEKTVKSNKKIYNLTLNSLSTNIIRLFSEDENDNTQEFVEEYIYHDLSEDPELVDVLSVNISEHELTELMSFIQNDHYYDELDWDTVKIYCEDNNLEILE